MSLFKANNLAFSKFKDLPVSISASNSEEIEDSNSNSPLDILSACSKFKPNCLACITDLVTASRLPPKDNFTALEALFTSLRTSLSFIADLLTALKATAVPNIALVLSLKSLPVALDILYIPVNSSA